MKGSVGMGMLNHLVLGLCPVNEWDRRVRGDDGGRGRGGSLGGSERVRQRKNNVKGTF